MKLIVAFRNFAKAPKNIRNATVYQGGFWINFESNEQNCTSLSIYTTEKK